MGKKFTQYIQKDFCPVDDFVRVQKTVLIVRAWEPCCYCFFQLLELDLPVIFPVYFALTSWTSSIGMVCWKLPGAIYLLVLSADC